MESMDGNSRKDSNFPEASNRLSMSILAALQSGESKMSRGLSKRLVYVPDPSTLCAWESQPHVDFSLDLETFLLGLGEDAPIAEAILQGWGQNEICEMGRIGTHRVSRVRKKLKEWLNG